MFKLHTSKQEKYFDEVIRLYYNEGYSKSKICRTLPIDRKTIFRWVEMYDKARRESAPDLTQFEVPCDQNSDNYVSVLETRVKELEQKASELETQLKYERLRAELYDKMIEITEAKFNIQIRSAAVLP